jgi:hypothetical protein
MIWKNQPAEPLVTVAQHFVLQLSVIKVAFIAGRDGSSVSPHLRRATMHAMGYRPDRTPSVFAVDPPVPGEPPMMPDRSVDTQASSVNDYETHGQPSAMSRPDGHTVPAFIVNVSTVGSEWQ